jgi:hypothetical protein
MEHRWSNEVGSRYGTVDICEVCQAMKVKPRVGNVLYIGKEGESPNPPECKKANERSQDSAAAR